MTTSVRHEPGNRETGTERMPADSHLPTVGGRPPVPDSRPVDVSVLVPAKDEAGNLPIFMEQAAAAFATTDVGFEVIVVDDGSEDDTWAVLQTLADQYPFLRFARHRVRRGIADALRT